MAAAPHPEILERMMAALAMSEEDMAQYMGPWQGGECQAPCCQSAPPEERARAARFNQAMKEELPPMPFGQPSTEMARYMLEHGEKMMKIEKKFSKKEHIDPKTFEERPCARSSCSKMAIKKCSRCRAVYYCSMECNAANWKIHKKDCKEVGKEECKVPKEKVKTKKEKKGKSITKADEAEVASKKKADEPISDEQAHKNMVRAFRNVFPESKVVNKRGQEYPKNY